MRKRMLLTLCVASLSVATSVQAIDLKAPNVGALKNATSVVSNVAASLTPSAVTGSVKSINQELLLANAKVDVAFDSLVSALSSKEEATKIKAEIKTIKENKNLSETEKSAKISTIMSDYGNALKENQAALAEQLKTASDAQITSIQEAISALAFASFDYLTIANECKNLGMSISTNPTLAISCASELASLKDTGVILKNSVSSLKNVTTQAVAVAKLSGHDVKLPKPGSTKAKKIELK